MTTGSNRIPIGPRHFLDNRSQERNSGASDCPMVVRVCELRNDATAGAGWDFQVLAGPNSSCRDGARANGHARRVAELATRTNHTRGGARLIHHVSPANAEVATDRRFLYLRDYSEVMTYRWRLLALLEPEVVNRLSHRSRSVLGSVVTQSTKAGAKLLLI